jgi:hypothetical protein
MPPSRLTRSPCSSPVAVRSPLSFHTARRWPLAERTMAPPRLASSDRRRASSSHGSESPRRTRSDSAPRQRAATSLDDKRLCTARRRPRSRTTTAQPACSTARSHPVLRPRRSQRRSRSRPPRTHHRLHRLYRRALHPRPERTQPRPPHTPGTRAFIIVVLLPRTVAPRSRPTLRSSRLPRISKVARSFVEDSRARPQRAIRREFAGRSRADVTPPRPSRATIRTTR